jgi:hypothetical protein
MVEQLFPFNMLRRAGQSGEDVCRAGDATGTQSDAVETQGDAWADLFCPLGARIKMRAGPARSRS